MDEHSLERIRNATFSHSVRGYDRGEVDTFLAELADWLQRGGEDEAAVEAVRAQLEHVGEQTSGILTEAHDAAEAIREDAAEDAREQLVDANVTAEKSDRPPTSTGRRRARTPTPTRARRARTPTPT